MIREREKVSSWKREAGLEKVSLDLIGLAGEERCEMEVRKGSGSQELEPESP